MSEKLNPLPCPACGGKAWAHYEPTTIRMHCPCCDILGPKKDTIEEARAAWNALPRALTWTNVPPKVLSWSKKERTHFNGHIVFYESRRARILEREEDATEYFGPIPEYPEPLNS